MESVSSQDQNNLRAGIKLFVIFIFILSAGGFFYMKSSQHHNRILRVAFPSKQKSTSYEPTRISLGHEYIFLENVFSPLVEISKDGSIEPGVAEKIDWVDDDLKLTIRKDLKTKSGIPITANDVVFSLKRLLIRSGNTHGNFKDIVCPGIELKTVEDSCPGIKQDGDSVYLNAKDKKTFLLPMLAAIDFAIIPKTSVDPTTLNIINFSDTSGPYYVKKDDGQGNIHLQLNTNHYFAATDIPEKIVLVPIIAEDKGSSIDALEKGLVDHLTTIDSAKADELIQFARQHSEFESHVTMKIQNMVVVFTEKGQKELSPGERRFIGEKLKSAFSKIYSGVPGFEQRSEFFPNLSEGGLTSDQQKRLAPIQSQNLTSPKIHFKLGLIKHGQLNDWAKPIREELPQADCYIETNAPDLKKDLKPEQMPHAFIASTDTGFLEDISLISYSLNAGLLGLAKSERAQWLANYMATDDKAERIHKLKDLHFLALSTPAIIPLMASPYAALVRKPWRMELSELYANNQLWRIKLR